MGEQVKELFNWARRRKIMAGIFVALTLVVGILIGSVVSGKVSAVKSATFAGTNATPLAVPEPIPASNSFSGIVNRVEPAVVNIATTQVMERRISLTSFSMVRRTDPRRPNAVWVPALLSTSVAISLRTITWSNKLPRFRCS